MLQLGRARTLLIPDEVTRLIREMQRTGTSKPLFEAYHVWKTSDDAKKWIQQNEKFFLETLRTT